MLNQWKDNMMTKDILIKSLSNKKSKRQKNELKGEFKKIKPPIFEGENEEVEKPRLIDMNKYF